MSAWILSLEPEHRKNRRSGAKPLHSAVERRRRPSQPRPSEAGALFHNALTEAGRTPSMREIAIFRQLLRGRIPANQMQCPFVLAAKFDRCDFAQLVEGRLTVPLGIWTNLQQSDLPLL